MGGKVTPASIIAPHKMFSGGKKESGAQKGMQEQQQLLARQQAEAQELAAKEKKRADELALRAIRGRGRIFFDDVEPGVPMQSVLRRNAEGL